MFGLGTTEILIILVVAVLIFGATRLPALGKSLGTGMRNFQKSVTGKDEVPQLTDGTDPAE
jgi:sec-independent protein translocase protein TatA